jgi:hypothetical protein
MLFGCPNIHVYTDHKNNMFDCLQTQCVLRWQLFLDDISVQFHYITHNSNLVADALSCLPSEERQKLYALSITSMSSIHHNHGYSQDS